MSAAREVAIVTFHFPPQGGAGSLRLLSFARHLPALGWRPRVLTVGDLGAGASDATLSARLPDGVRVERRFTELASWAYRRSTRREPGRAVLRRILDLVGSYPDPAIAWSLASGYALGRELRDGRTSVFVTSSPPHSLHAAGLVASAISGVPWVLDLRDPWGSNRPLGISRFRYLVGEALERGALARASCVLANTPRLAAALERRESPPRRVVVMPNGYDEDEIATARRSAAGDAGRFTVVHAGALYAGQRDPLRFLEALARARELAPRGRSLRFVLPGDSSFHRNPVLRETVSRLGLDGAVETPGYVPHAEALAVMAAADVLLLIQGAGFHLQVPSKAYEYLALGPPVLALTSEGATADLVRSSPSGRVVAPDDEEGLVRALVDLMGRNDREIRPGPPPTVLSRREIAARLAAALDETAAPKPVY